MWRTIISNCSSSWLRSISLLALLSSACGGDSPSKPSVTGAPPAFLAGIWALEDSLTLCEPFAPVWALGSSVDTICAGGPDFGFENAWSAWRVYATLYSVDSGMTLTSCSGFVSDAQIDVTCRGEDQYLYDYTGEICHYLVTIHTQGRPDSNGWCLLRAITRSYIGEACGGIDRDTFDVCQVYVSNLKRIGDAPDPCEGLTDNSIGHP